METIKYGTTSYMSMNTQKLIVITGPTATGKTSLAIELAQKYSGEVISADSRQVYRGLDIGSAKVTAKEMKGVPHHLLDVADPQEVFSVSDYKKQGRIAINTIVDNQHLPIICGGTGFYIDALVYDHEFPQVPANSELRKELNERSVEDLYEELLQKDARRAQDIGMHNKVRLIRALEIYEELGYVPEINHEYTSSYDILYICLKRERESHFADIDARITERLEQGMLEEVRTLYKNGVSWERLESFGLEYRYLAQHLQGKISLQEAIEILSQETKKFVKRQYTWFRKNPQVLWFDPVTQRKEILNTVNEFLEK